MFKKLILVGFVFLFSFNLARAEVVINEIMYAPASGSNYEWVEIFNSGTTPIDLQGWRFFHGEANSGPLTLRNGNTTILQPSGYAVIAKNPSVVTDYAWLNFSGMILSASTLSLPDGADNTYIAIASDVNKTISNSVVYDTSLGGSKDSGNSLQKISGSWSGAMPTPGVINETISPPSSNNTSNENPASSVATAEPKTKIAEEPKIKTQILGKTLGFVGIPVSLEAKTLGLSGEPLRYGKYFWNFGDGDSKETEVAYGGKFTHTYFYPGDYTVSLDYFSNPYIYSNTPDASSQIIIKIIETDISISRVGDEKDFFVELSNNTDYSADLSNWFLMSDTKSFTIPRQTILAAKKKLIISPRITNFSVADKNTLKLVNPEGEIVFKLAQVAQGPSWRKEKLPLNSETEIPTDNLQAAAISSGTDNDNTSNSSLPIIPLASFVFIGASAGAVYFIRRNRVTLEKTDDFEILDE